MAGSEYYDHTTYPSTGADGSSSAMRAELELIEAGFGKLPTLAGSGGKAVTVKADETGLEATNEPLTTGVTAGKAQQVDQATTATTRAATTTLGTTLKHTLSDTATTITAFNGVQGVTYHVRFLGAGNITHHATNLIITQTGADIATAAGDTCDIYMLTATTCRIQNYIRASGGALAYPGGTFTGLVNLAAGADIASAATVDLTGATGNCPRVTGTTPTSAVVMNTGQLAMVVADGAWPLTYNATTNKITGGLDYTCGAGDVIIYYKDLSGVVHGLIQKASAVPDSGPIDIAWFGAKQDGTDDSSYVQAAIDSLSSGEIYTTAPFSTSATINIPAGIVFNCHWSDVTPLADVDVFHVSPGGTLKNTKIDATSLTTYSSIAAKLVPAANVQGDKYAPWFDGLNIQFYSSGVGKGTGVYYDGSEYYIQLTQGNNLSVRYGEYGIRMVGGDEALEYVNGNTINGYTNFRSTHSIHGDASSTGNIFADVILQGNPDGAISLAGGTNIVHGVAWDDIAITTAGAGNNFAGLMGSTQYGMALTTPGTDTRSISRGSTYYDGTSVNTRDDWRHELNGPGKIEFRDFILGGRDPRWTQTLTGTATAAFGSAVWGNATGQKQWMPYMAFTCPSGANNALWDFGGNGFVRTNQNIKVHFTNWTNSGDGRVIWEIGLYNDASNYILLRQDFGAYGDDDLRFITAVGGVTTTSVLSTAATDRINFCSFFITDTAATVRVKQYLNTGTGDTGKVARGVLWDGTEVTATNTTNIPVNVDLEPRIFVDHGSGGSNGVMYLFDYQLVAGRKSQL